MVLRHDVAIVVDSSSCLPAELIAEWKITVVPHELVLNDRTLRDGLDIQPSEFYKLLRQGNVAPTTNAPNSHQFLQGFQTASRLAPNVLCLTLATQFSMAYRSACSAALDANDNLPNVKVVVIDSKTAAGSLGLITLAAARWGAAGHTLDETVERVARLIPKVHLLAFLDTLKYVTQGGRVKKPLAIAGSLLGIKPLTEMKLGEAKLLEKPRSRAKATQRLVDIMGKSTGGQRVAVTVLEADAREDAEALAEVIKARFTTTELFISEFTPVMGAHTGPGLLGVSFYVDEDELG